MLRWGIVLYGFRLTLAQVAAVGVPAVVVDLIVVTVTILGGVWSLVRIQSPRLMENP